MMSEQTAVDLGLSVDGMFLVFSGHGDRGKMYARTPLGEYAFSHTQGLYEWTRDAEGNTIRVDHTGGDRTGVHGGRMTHSNAPPGPKDRGHAASRSTDRSN